ncbi:protein unc-45 homolog A-like [Podargus strigoides]
MVSFVLAPPSVQNLHLCEGYAGPDGRCHPGFYCPRLSDPPGHRYCCRPGPHALKSCCSQLALQGLTRVNLSGPTGPGLLRNPLALPFAGLYGLLVLLLMAACHVTRAAGLLRRSAVTSRARRQRRDGGGGDHAAALAAYTEALSLCDAEPDRTVLHRNRAACYLKLDDYAKAEADASKAIEADGRDMKALFRRSQALQKLGRLGQAVSDLQRCVSLEPKNKALQEALRALGSSMHEKMKTMSCTDSKVEQMFQILLDSEEKDVGKRSELWGAEGDPHRSLSQAAQNLIVLAQEEAGAEKIFQSDGVQLLTQLLDTAKADLMLAALRTLVGLCSGHRSRTTAILAELGSPRLSAVLGVEHEQVSLAACNLLHVMFDSLKEGLQKDFCGKKDAVVLDTSKDLKMLIKDLLDLLVLEGASAHGRDNALNLLIEVVPRKSPKETNNSMSLWVIDQGLKKILEVGSAVCGAPGSLPVTENSWMSASVLLSKLYDDLKCNAERENFHHLCEDYVRSWFEGHELTGKLRAIQTVSCQTVSCLSRGGGEPLSTT